MRLCFWLLLFEFLLDLVFVKQKRYFLTVPKTFQGMELPGFYFDPDRQRYFPGKAPKKIDIAIECKKKYPTLVEQLLTRKLGIHTLPVGVHRIDLPGNILMHEGQLIVYSDRLLEDGTFYSMYSAVTIDSQIKISRTDFYRHCKKGTKEYLLLNELSTQIRNSNLDDLGDLSLNDSSQSFFASDEGLFQAENGTLNQKYKGYVSVCESFSFGCLFASRSAVKMYSDGKVTTLLSGLVAPCVLYVIDEKTFLVGCIDQRIAWFSLDVGCVDWHSSNEVGGQPVICASNSVFYYKTHNPTTLHAVSVESGLSFSIEMEFNNLFTLNGNVYITE